MPELCNIMHYISVDNVSTEKIDFSNTPSPLSLSDSEYHLVGASETVILHPINSDIGSDMCRISKDHAFVTKTFISRD